MKFELTKELLTRIEDAVDAQDTQFFQDEVCPLHSADIAEIIDEVNLEQAQFIYRQLDKERAAEVLVELEEDVRDEFLKSLSDDEIAFQVERMDSDDAADFIQDLPEDRKDEILSNLEDVEHSSDIASLLSYDEDTAGGLMAKEFICANINWTVGEALANLREQAQEINYVYTIYTVDDHNRLMGTLSLKTFLYSDNDTKIKDLYADDPISVNAATDDREVARIMEKYDLVAIPVVNHSNVLIGRITIDDVVDVIKEDAERERQLATGVSEKIESRDSIWVITRARLPWLLIGMMGGVFGALVIGRFEGQLDRFPELAFFIPLIAAMGGNIGVQSSSLIVQGLANNTLKFDSTLQKILKEVGVALVNGAVLSSLIFIYNFAFGENYSLCFTVSVALFAVIILAGILGSLVPLLLHRYKIDPALATGPFITTLNDILGLLLYFMIGYAFY
ncbi:magnesium transporter [Parvicella tangerina]|uniref:Magnesium transporter MgtE n=1 Tax=Parvicella tangerina TaxID=2829795 RepID=A0A916JQ67_9FLAO|nr:magnesium transporter [Parvicella tangerina]CAG5086682.1 Magnesium transporter MgtE [Parvicella tangerina]